MAIMHQSQVEPAAQFSVGRELKMSRHGSRRYISHPIVASHRGCGDSCTRTHHTLIDVGGKDRSPVLVRDLLSFDPPHPLMKRMDGYKKKKTNAFIIRFPPGSVRIYDVYST